MSDDERASLLGLFLPVGNMMPFIPVPEDSGGRAHFIHLYAGTLDPPPSTIGDTAALLLAI